MVRRARQGFADDGCGLRHRRRQASSAAASGEAVRGGTLPVAVGAGRLASKSMALRHASLGDGALAACAHSVGRTRQWFAGDGRVWWRRGRAASCAAGSGEVTRARRGPGVNGVRARVESGGVAEGCAWRWCLGGRSAWVGRQRRWFAGDGRFLRGRRPAVSAAAGSGRVVRLATSVAGKLFYAGKRATDALRAAALQWAVWTHCHEIDGVRTRGRSLPLAAKLLSGGLGKPAW